MNAERKNPYRVIERLARKAGEAIGIVVMCLAVLSAFGIVIHTMWTESGWGAWALTVPLISAAALVVCVLLLAAIWSLFGFIEDRWRLAARRWDERARAVEIRNGEHQ